VLSRSSSFSSGVGSSISSAFNSGSGFSSGVNGSFGSSLSGFSSSFHSFRGFGSSFFSSGGFDRRGFFLASRESESGGSSRGGGEKFQRHVQIPPTDHKPPRAECLIRAAACLFTRRA
jgi:hypothetical protein